MVGSPGPVSYTHLDVYKRQPIYNCEQACADKNIVEVREMLVKVPAPKNHPEIDELTVIGNPIKMTETPCVDTKAAPRCV